MTPALIGAGAAIALGSILCLVATGASFNWPEPAWCPGVGIAGLCLLLGGTAAGLVAAGVSWIVLAILGLTIAIIAGSMMLGRWLGRGRHE